MMKTFSHVEYKGGHPYMTKPCKVNVTVDEFAHEVTLKQDVFVAPMSVKLKAEDILGMSFEEKTKRSVGKTAAGAIIGGVLTGGIGLLVGGALGAMRKDISNLFITVNVGGRQHEIILKAGKHADGIYAAISGV
jgi:hypothetical protein